METRKKKLLIELTTLFLIFICAVIGLIVYFMRTYDLEIESFMPVLRVILTSFAAIFVFAVVTGLIAVGAQMIYRHFRNKR